MIVTESEIPRHHHPLFFNSSHISILHLLEKKLKKKLRDRNSGFRLAVLQARQLYRCTMVGQNVSEYKQIQCVSNVSVILSFLSYTAMC